MVPLELVGISQQDEESLPIVLLRNDDRILPIVVGPAEASAIQIVLLGQTPARPLTHDLICNLLAGLRGHLQSVTIYKLENDIFFAHLNIEQRSAAGQVEQVLRVDTRPSDGIAVAVRMQCPIFASEEVMDVAARRNVSILEEGEGEDEEGEGGEDSGAPDFDR